MHPYTTEYVKLTDEEWTRTYKYLYARPVGLRIFYGVLFVAGVIAWLTMGNSLIGRIGFGAMVGGPFGLLVGRIYMLYWIRKEISDAQTLP